MRQPIKLLPYFGNMGQGGDHIARFKGLSVNCSAIGESWELSVVPGKQSIVAEGDNAGMELQALVDEGQFDRRRNIFAICRRISYQHKTCGQRKPSCCGSLPPLGQSSDAVFILSGKT